MCLCASLCQWGGLLSHGPAVLQGNKKKKPDSEPSRGSIVGERESLAGFANWSPPKLNKQKSSTASSLFLQHGLMHYGSCQSQRRGQHRADHSPWKWRMETATAPEEEWISRRTRKSIPGWIINFQQCCKVTAFSAEISFKVKLMSNCFITDLSFSFISPWFQLLVGNLWSPFGALGAFVHK